MNLMAKRQIPMPARYLINTALVALLLLLMRWLLVAEVLTGYNVKVLMLVGVNIILAVSLNVASGYLGQLPLGHAGFMAVGAYACGIFLKAADAAKATGVTYLGLVLAGLLLAGTVAALFGLVIGVPALRLKGDYLAIVTLGFGEIIRVVLLNIDGVLGFRFTYGASSLKSIPKFTTAYNTFFSVVVVCLIIHMVMKSRHGRAILALRENEIAAESCGIKTTYYKVMAFVMSAFFAGLAGGLYAGYIGSLNPSGFGFMKSIEILVMVVLGGMGSMVGSVLSAAVLTVLPEALREFDSYRMVAYSLVLILMMIFKPSGLMGTYDLSVSRLLEKAWNRLAPSKSSRKGEAKR